MTFKYGYQAFATYKIREFYPNLGIEWISPRNTDSARLDTLYNNAVNRAETNGYNVNSFKRIVNEGAEHVAFNHTWESATYDWFAKDLNNTADTLSNTYVSGQIRRVSEVVNLHMSNFEYQIREDHYRNWMNNFDFLR